MQDLRRSGIGSNRQMDRTDKNEGSKRVQRGFIKELFVENFKSYRGKHTIGPFSEKLTCIVGPNGSGKSNLMDALSFALGLSSNNMRSTNLKDLIYSPEQGGGQIDAIQSNDIPSDSNQSKTLNTANNAEVSIIFVDVDKKEITFSRRIISNGTSRYMINGGVVSQDTYVRKLADYNILVKARNFLVFQGDVEDVAQRAPKELTNLFEKISGSDELIEGYDRLSSEQSLNQIVSHNIFNRRKLLEAEKRELQKQIEEVNEYEKLVEQKNALQVEQLLFQLYCNEVFGGKLFEESQLINNEIKLLDKNIEETKIKMKENESNIAKDNLEWNKQSKELENLEREETINKNEQIRMENSVKHNTQELKKIMRQIDSILSCEKKDRKVLEEYSTQIEFINAELNELEQQPDEYKLMDAISTDLQEYIESKKMADMASSNLREDLLQLEREISSKCGLIEITEKEHDEIQIQIVTNKGIIDQISSKITEHEERLKFSKETEIALNQQISELRANFNGITDKIAKLVEERKYYNEKIKNIDAKKGEIQREMDTRRLIEEMKSHINKGSSMGIESEFVFGRLSELCHSNNKQFTSSLESALGKYCDHIVVSTWETARSCINWLRQNKKQAMNFLPLNSIKLDRKGDVSLFEASMRALCDENKSIRLLAKDNLHVSDERIQPVLDFCLYSVIFTQNLEDAKRIFYIEAPRLGITPKVMTFDGERILKNGNISFDYSKGKNNSKNFAKEYASLTCKIESLSDEIKVLEELESDGQTKLLRLDENVKRLKLEKNSIEMKVEIYSKNKKEKIESIEILEKKLDEIAKDLLAKRSEYEKLNAKAEQIRKEIHDSDQRHFVNLSKKLNIDDISSLEQNFRKRHEELLQKKKKLSSKLNMLEEECDSICKRTESLREKYDEKKERITKLESFVTEENERLVKLKEDHLMLEEKQKGIKDAMKSIAMKKKETQMQLETKRKMLSDLHKSYTSKKLEKNSKNEELEALNGELIALLKNIVFEDIKVPLISGEYEDLRKYWEFFEMNKDGNNLEGMEPPVIQIDYSSLTKEQKCFSESKEKIEREVLRLSVQISEITEKLESMNPNMKSRSKFKEIDLQLEALIEDQKETRRKSMEIDKSFKLLRKKRTETFMRCFEAVKEAVGEFYSQLTCNEGDIGGQAFLDLDDTNLEEPFACGIIFHAMPPSKRFRDIQQLSGGEKTMAALALLFAVQSYHPSPFFVLDEVDAALDPRNVQSIARFLKRAPFQSIVISLKDRLFSQADSLIGVFKDRLLQTSSTLTLDLQKYSCIKNFSEGHKENFATNSVFLRNIGLNKLDDNSATTEEIPVERNTAIENRI
ncbi:hypothetical protein HWI79_1553 [Cryptosporidium felis]|nr:hypothetical protein HWI79_1553 [Cryptosporidium felis]